MTPAGLAGDRAKGVFGQLLGKLSHAHVPVHAYGLGDADGHALAAANAGVLVDAGLGALLWLACRGSGGADGDAQAAGYAGVGVDLELDAVLFALAYEWSAAHGEVLYGAAEAGHLVAFDVGHDDHAVGGQDAAGYLG